jgi:hypothetical protein
MFGRQDCDGILCLEGRIVTEFCVWRAELWRNFVFGRQDCGEILCLEGRIVTEFCVWRAGL